MAGAGSAKLRLGLVLMIAAFGFVLAFRPPHEAVHVGETMGTTFRVKWITRDGAGATDAIRSAIDTRLERVNDLLSTYRPDSELSRFNRSPAAAWFPVSSETGEVMEAAFAVYRASDGAFDPTVGPLVDLWGFGPPERPIELPDSASIAKARALTGLARVEFRPEDPALRKSHPTIRLDLSAIAKGYGVDLLGRLLEERGFGDYFVEIGGEILLGGTGLGGKPWSVAIESPRPGERTVARVIEARGPLGIAGSGTYRNYYDSAGNRYSHTIDPATGRPVTHGTAGVTVFAPNCMLADAWATALLVLGGERAAAVADREGVAAVILADPEREGGLDETLTKSYLQSIERGELEEIR